MNCETKIIASHTSTLCLKYQLVKLILYKSLTKALITLKIPFREADEKSIHCVVLTNQNRFHAV